MLTSELDALSHALKLLAQELCCPVIVTTQLGRRMEMRRDKRPRLEDLRAGGRLEQAADLIITVYRDDYYNHDASHSPGVAEINVVKHLNGTTGFVMLAFNKSLTRFENLTNTHQHSSGLNMNLPEYLVLFSNEGTIDVKVNFKDHDGSISNRKMWPNEIAASISTNGEGFHTQMAFDEWPFVITKYEIEPALNKLTIVVRKIS